jgi:hypothetical protein
MYGCKGKNVGYWSSSRELPEILPRRARRTRRRDVGAKVGGRGFCPERKTRLSGHKSGILSLAGRGRVGFCRGLRMGRGHKSGDFCPLAFGLERTKSRRAEGADRGKGCQGGQVVNLAPLKFFRKWEVWLHVDCEFRARVGEAIRRSGFNRIISLVLEATGDVVAWGSRTLDAGCGIASMGCLHTCTLTGTRGSFLRESGRILWGALWSRKWGNFTQRRGGRGGRAGEMSGFVLRLCDLCASARDS